MEKKDAIHTFINELTVGSLTIDYQTAMHIEKKQTNEIKLPLMGGMTTVSSQIYLSYPFYVVINLGRDGAVCTITMISCQISRMTKRLSRSRDLPGVFLCSFDLFCGSLSIWACLEIATVQRNINGPTATMRITSLFVSPGLFIATRACLAT